MNSINKKRINPQTGKPFKRGFKAACKSRKTTLQHTTEGWDECFSSDEFHTSGKLKSLPKIRSGFPILLS